MQVNQATSYRWICGSELYRARLIEFNYHPAAWARPERLGLLCPMLADPGRLGQNARAERFLSRYILSAWQLEEPYVFEFQSPGDKIVLVSADALEQLAERLGLLCHGDVIRLCVRREDRARLVQAIGEQRRQYALSGAVRYGNSLGTFAGAVDDLTLNCVRLAGWRCVLSCSAAAVAAARKRFELKLPGGVELNGGGGGPDMWPLVERVLKSEFRGEWQACCC